MSMIDVLAGANSPVSLKVYAQILQILSNEITDASVFGNLAIKYLKV
jgi:hypothetical protein